MMVAIRATSTFVYTMHRILLYYLISHYNLIRKHKYITQYNVALMPVFIVHADSQFEKQNKNKKEKQ